MGVYKTNESKSILLVEDNKHDQFFFELAVEEIENAALFGVARNGREALSLLAAALILPDFIFTDINMPIMDGLECLAEIRKNPRTRDIPVVILSTDIGKVAIARELGAKAFIAKPDNCMMLKPQLEQLLNLNFKTDMHVANKTFQTAMAAF